METLTKNIISPVFVVPPLPKEALVKLPRYCPQPTERNLATLYYYWSRELIKENRELKKQLEKVEQENKQIKEENQQLRQEKEELTLERDKFLRMVFKPKPKRSTAFEQITTSKPRTKESYQRPVPEEVDEYRETTLCQCPFCQGELREKVSSYERTIEDIPSFTEQRVKITKYTINRYWCRNCRKIVTAKPKEVLPRTRLGPNALLYVIYGKYRLRLPQNLIKENLNNYFHLKVSNGEINNLLAKAKLIFQDKWQEIIERIQKADSVNADESGWRIDGENCWLWAFTNDQVSRYTISESRGKGVPQKVLGEDFQGVVIADFYPAYNQFKNKQRCWTHLLRKSKELTQINPTRQRKTIHHKLKRIYLCIIDFRSQAETTKEQREKKAEEIKDQLMKISKTKTKDHNLQKLLNLCGKYAQELVVCVENFKVPPENNRAERAIRPAVVMRKISGGSRSKQGAQIQAINLSVIETLLKESPNLFEAMHNLVLKHIASIA